MAGVLKVKDPTTGLWLDVIGGAGPKGVMGPTGPTGPTGSAGTTGPTGTLPPGGAVDQALTKVDATDGNATWTGPYLQLTGGTISGNLTVTGNASVTGTLTSPTVNGNVNFVNDISANAVTDRTAYTMETVNLEPSLLAHWYLQHTLDSWPDPCHASRNRYSVVVNMAPIREQGWYEENSWMDVIQPGSLPVGYRPGFDLWWSIMGVETDESGSLFEVRITNTGSIQINMKGLTLDWQSDCRIPIYCSFPRSA